MRKADLDAGGIISVDEVYSYISKKAPEVIVQNQNPVKEGEGEVEGECRHRRFRRPFRQRRLANACGVSLMSRDPDQDMDEATRMSYTYFVSEQQLAHYATLTLLERLTWLDQARQFVLLAETEETAKRRARLRNEKAL